MFGGGRATIYEPGFLSYVRSQVMYRRIDPKEVDHNSLYQLALIFAGTMPWLQKSEYKELVQEFGGYVIPGPLLMVVGADRCMSFRRVQKKVNTKTNYVVLGYKDVPEAVMKAIEDLGVKTLDEDGFIELLRTRKSPGVGGSRISMEGVEKDLADTGDAEKEKEKEEKEKQVAEKGGVVGDLADTGKEKKKGKQAAGKAKKVGAEKKNGSGVEKKDAEKQKNPAKKIAGVKKQSGGEASTKAQKEQWAGRLRSRAEEG